MLVLVAVDGVPGILALEDAHSDGGDAKGSARDGGGVEGEEGEEEAEEKMKLEEEFIIPQPTLTCWTKRRMQGERTEAKCRSCLCCSQASAIATSGLVRWQGDAAAAIDCSRWRLDYYYNYNYNSMIQDYHYAGLQA